MTEIILSFWIWIRERVDSDISHRTTAMIAENNLMSVRETIEKNKQKAISEYDELSTDLRCKARSCRGGTKEQRVFKLKKLIPLMQKCKRCRNQIQMGEKHTRLLDVQLAAFENGRFQKEMTDTLRASVTAMKRIGITEDIRLVDDMMVEVEESYIQQRDISDSMESSLINNMEDNTQTDESLMRELMQMMGEEEEVEEGSTVDTPTQEPTCPVIAEPIAPTIPSTVAHQQERRKTLEQQEQIQLQQYTRPSLAGERMSVLEG
jgi:hypothetical protein